MTNFETLDGALDASDGGDSYSLSQLVWKVALDFAPHSPTRRIVEDDDKHGIAAPGNVPRYIMKHMIMVCSFGLYAKKSTVPVANSTRDHITKLLLNEYEPSEKSE